MDEQMMREKLLSLKYHHQASHVPPDHRDQHNREIDEIIAALSQPAAQGGNAASGLSDWQLRDMGIDPSKRHSQSFEWPFPKPKATP